VPRVRHVMQRPSVLWDAHGRVFLARLWLILRVVGLAALPLGVEIALTYVAALAVCPADGSVDLWCVSAAKAARAFPLTSLAAVAILAGFPAIRALMTSLRRTMYAERYMVGRKLVNYVLPGETTSSLPTPEDARQALDALADLQIGLGETRPQPFTVEDR